MVLPTGLYPELVQYTWSPNSSLLGKQSVYLPAISLPRCSNRNSDLFSSCLSHNPSFSFFTLLTVL
jgi:hypothetical protein